MGHHYYNGVMMGSAIFVLLYWDSHQSAASSTAAAVNSTVASMVGGPSAVRAIDTEDYIIAGLEILEQIAGHWPAVMAVFQNVCKRIDESAYTRTQAAVLAAREIQSVLQAKLESAAFEPESQLNPLDTAKAALIFCSLTASAEEMKKRQARLLASTAAAGQRSVGSSADPAGQYKNLQATLAMQADELATKFKATLQVNVDPLELPILRQSSTPESAAAAVSIVRAIAQSNNGEFSPENLSNSLSRSSMKNSPDLAMASLSPAAEVAIANQLEPLANQFSFPSSSVPLTLESPPLPEPRSLPANAANAAVFGHEISTSFLCAPSFIMESPQSGQASPNAEREIEKYLS